MTEALARAVSELKQENNCNTCALCHSDVVYTTTQRGVKPLLDWLDGGTDLKGFSAADKVVGRAAAFLYVLLGVREVYAFVISEAAVSVLKKHGIDAKYEKSVPHIINRMGNGMCPMEQAVLDIEDPDNALTAIRKRLAELTQN